MKKTKKQKLKSYYFGILAEYLVIIFLFFKGYKFLKRRYKNYYGEIDLIFKKNNLLVIVEVKARRIINTIEEILSYHQQRRIIDSALKFVAKNKKYQNLGIRFDLVIILPFKMPLHLKGYWD